MSFQKNLSIVFMSSLFSSALEGFKAWNCFILFPSGEYVNLVLSSIILLWSEGNISLPVRNSYLSSLPNDNINIFAASLLILYCSISWLIVSSTAVISFYIPSKRLFLKSEELFDVKVE